jgi:hypothetical protein
MGFFGNGVKLRYTRSSEYFGFPLSVPFHRRPILIYSSITGISNLTVDAVVKAIKIIPFEVKYLLILT